MLRVSAPVLAFSGVVLSLLMISSSSRVFAADYPPHAEVLKDFEKVVSTADGKKSMWTVWTRSSDNQMLAELPKTFGTQKYFIALTVASGDSYAGLQSGEYYCYWRKYNKRLALIAPETDIRSTGDAESKSSVKRLFTGRVLLDLPIVTMGPGGGPIIDMDYLLVVKSPIFYDSQAFNKSMPFIYSIKKAKAFPDNVELAFEQPDTRGRLRTLHYSISKISSSAGYKPRKADERIGYFTTSYSDLGKYSDDETKIRYINRWHLEKADPKLKMSPPKNPIVFYIEHTTPIRYRRWVREGILAWNKAFEKVGISDAIEVYYQDVTTGAHMDKDPEDVRYNFVRWLNNDEGTAIGPSRVNPETGQILDADIILTDGWIRHYRWQFEDLLPNLAMEGMGPTTLSWLAKHPDWDPRVRLASPSLRPSIQARIAREASGPYGGHAMAKADPSLMGDNQFDGLVGRTSQTNGLCLAAQGKAFDMALMHMSLSMAADMAKQAAEKEKEEKDKDEKDESDDEKEEEKEEEELLDGMPEAFVGPLISNLVAHEVGHTLGLRHNFKSSAIKSMAEINSKDGKGTAQVGSVMDYTPVNIRMETGEEQGDYVMQGLGPYDLWAIQYGYTFDTDLKPILNRVAEPELVFGTDEDTDGPDPLARRYDFGADPLSFAQEQILLAKYHRERLLKGHVKDGESWSRVRRGYSVTLSLQLRSLSMMSNWIGGVHIYRDKKGDKNGRAPNEVVDVKKQRDALEFIIKNSFYDEAYGLNPELLKWMTTDKWLDDFRSAMQDSTYPVHDKIMGVQSSTLTMLMNPTTLQRVYDNEFRTPADQDALTLPELLNRVTNAIWEELDEAPGAKHSARKPMISSLRRNLQREHLNRLIDLSMSTSSGSSADKPISTLARMQITDLQKKLPEALKKQGDKIDPYTRAHLEEAQSLMKKALEAQYILNDGGGSGGGGFHLSFGQEEDE